jgi:peptide deformylase
MLLELVKYPSPYLRQKAWAVSQVDDEIRELTQQMVQIMYGTNGIGLAANQVGRSERIFVMDPWQDEPENLEFTPALICINPEIISKEGSQKTKEGCLSIPKYFAQIERAKKVVLRFHTLEGEVKEVELEGLAAVVAQHELDHLDGILFVDHMPKIKQKMFIKKFGYDKWKDDET